MTTINGDAKNETLRSEEALRGSPQGTTYEALLARVAAYWAGGHEHQLEVLIGGAVRIVG